MILVFSQILTFMPGKYTPKHDLKILTAVIPVNCPNLDKLVVGTSICADRLRVLLHQIYVVWIYEELSDKKKDRFHKEGWVRLSSVRLKTLLSGSCNKYEEFLESQGIIEIKRTHLNKKSYISGKRATPYRIKPSFLLEKNGRRFRHEKITSYRCLVGIFHDNRKLQEQLYFDDVLKVKSLLPVHHQLTTMFSSFHFDQISLRNFLDDVQLGKIVTERKTNKGLFDAEMLVNIINETPITEVVVDHFGERYHSVFTRLPREYRHFLRVHENAEVMCSVDIANCQAYLVALICSYPDLVKIILPEFGVVLDKIKTVPVKTRIHFFELCSSGQIYEYWMPLRNLASRDEAKDEIIKRILFDSLLYKQKKYAKAREKFTELFPDVMDCIVVMKSICETELSLVNEIALDKNGNFGGRKDYHKTISCMCQRLESRIMIHMVVPALLKQNVGPFLTVHDSILLPVSKSQQVNQLIVECFKRLGVKPPKVKIDIYETISSDVIE